jgi:hypothetical protein
MRMYLTGASGFVGLNLAHVFADVARPPDNVVAAGGVPRDTRLDAGATARALGAPLPDLGTMLGRLRAEVESSCSLA